MINILQSYSFQVVSLGTMLLAIGSAMVGCLNVFKGQSLIGDAVGHSSFPGVVLFFIIFQSRAPELLLFGAMFTGALCYLFIQLSKSGSKVNLDAGLAIFLSGFFGLGLVLKSMIQGSPAFKGASQSGLENYIFGQAAYMMVSDVKLIVAVSLPVLILLAVFYKELKLYIFDMEYARVIGISRNVMEGILLIMTIALIGVGLKAVGAILISSFLIMPCAAATQWSRRLDRVLLISASIGAASAFTGTLLSSMAKGLSTGPVIILVAGCIAIFSMLFGTHGAVSRAAKRRGKA